MKEKKNKGSISIVVLIMMILLITIGLVFYDFTRLSTSREHIDRSLVNAMDSALVEYDENIYTKYNLMAFSKDKNADAIVKQRLDIILNRKNTKKDLSSYNLIAAVNLTGGKLSKEKAIKRAILRSHQKKFVANKVSEWLDKLELLEMIPEYSKSMKLYAKSIKVIAKLKDKYDDLREKSEAILEKYSVVKGINIKNCVNQIIDIKQKIEELREKEAYWQEKKYNLISSANNSEFVNQLQPINEELNYIRKKISGLKSKLKGFKEDIASVKELAKKLTSYSNKLSNFCTDIQHKSSDLREDINEIDFNKNEKLQNVMEKISKILLKVEKASDKLAKISKKVAEYSTTFNEQVAKIDKHLNNSEKIYKQITIDLGNIDDINSDNLISLFGDKNLLQSASIDIILDFIWESIAGDYLPAFDNLSDLELDSVANLPSSSLALTTDNLEGKLNKPSSEYAMADSALETYENKADANTNSEIGEKTNQFFQKLIIADYAVTTFSNVNKSRAKEGSNDYQAEVEYILSGNSSAKKNVLITQGKIYSLRMVFNGIAILMYKQVEINELATSLSSVTGFLGYPIAYGLVSLGWSAIESAQDIKTLNSGGSVPILKVKTELKTDLANIAKNASMASFKESIKQSAKDILKSETSEEIDLESENPLSMDYQDHLVLFLILEDETETLVRISDLICLKENINTNNFYTALHSIIKVEIPVIFRMAKNKLTEDSTSSYIYQTEKVRGY